MRRTKLREPGRARFPFIRREFVQDYDGRFDGDFERFVLDGSPRPSEPDRASVSWTTDPGTDRDPESWSAGPDPVATSSVEGCLRAELDRERDKVEQLESRLRIAHRCLEQASQHAVRTQQELAEYTQEVLSLRRRLHAAGRTDAPAAEPVPSRVMNGFPTFGRHAAAGHRTVILTAPITVDRLYDGPGPIPL